MLSRFAAFLIVTFWFVMTLLLVRNEISPDASRLREVPIAHVLKMLYLHEQPSDLTVYNGPTSIGSVRLHPRTDPATQRRMLDLAGDLRLALGAGQNTRLNWLGVLEMTPAYDIQRSKWTVTIVDPGYLRAEVEMIEGSKMARYTLRTRDTSAGSSMPDRVLTEGEIPMSKGGLDGLARQLNLGANLDVLTKQGQGQEAPAIRARQSTLRWRGERTETYLVTIEQNGQMLIEAHFSQLGQMLMARTVLGYTLRSSDLMP
jgi:hypothetical protein